MTNASPEESARQTLRAQDSKCWRCCIELELELGAALVWPHLTIVVCETCLSDVDGTVAELRTRGYALGQPLSVDELFAIYGRPTGPDAAQIEARLREDERVRIGRRE